METRRLQLVDPADAGGMVRLARLDDSGNLAFVGRRGEDWGCGACGALMLRRVKPGVFGSRTVVACEGCGALNRAP